MSIEIQSKKDSNPLNDSEEVQSPEALIEKMFNNTDEFTSDNAKVLMELLNDKNIVLKTDLNEKDIQRLRLQLLWVELIKPYDIALSNLGLHDAINYMKLRVSLKRKSREELIKGISQEITDALKKNVLDKFIH